MAKITLDQARRSEGELGVFFFLTPEAADPTRTLFDEVGKVYSARLCSVGVDNPQASFYSYPSVWNYGEWFMVDYPQFYFDKVNYYTELQEALAEMIQYIS